MRIALVLFVLVLGFAIGFPQPAVADTALGTSTWSLEFGSTVGGWSADAFGIALRRHSGASSAFRFSIDADFDEGDLDGTITTTGAPGDDAKDSQIYNSHAFSIQWMRFAQIRDNVAATLAIGPVVELYRNGYRNGNYYGTPSFNENEWWQQTTSYGVNLGLGVEWFFNPRFSLGGQSGVRATTGTRTFVNIERSGSGATLTMTERNLEGDVTRVTTSSAKIYLTGYF